MNPGTVLPQQWTFGVKAIRAVTMFLAIVTTAWAQSNRPLDVAAVRSQLLRLEKTWNDAHEGSEEEILQRLWADELVMTLPGMKPMGKAEALQYTLGARARVQTYVTSDLNVNVWQDAAIVTGRVQRTRRVREVGMHDDWYFTKVYIRVGDDWNVVAWHGSRGPPPF
jgi:hypothetical protein